MGSRGLLWAALCVAAFGLSSCKGAARRAPAKGQAADGAASRPAVGARPGTDAGARAGTGGPGAGEAMLAAEGRLEVAFLGFDQSRDGRQRLVRYQLTNRAGKPIQAVRLRFLYRDREGREAGSFPLQVVRPKGTFAAGVTFRDAFELLGQQGPVDAVADVRIAIDELRLEDGTRWSASEPRPR